MKIGNSLKIKNTDNNKNENSAIRIIGENEKSQSNERYQKQVDDAVNYFTYTEKYALRKYYQKKIDKEGFCNEIKKYLNNIRCNPHDIDEITLKVHKALIGYDKLEDLLNDRLVSDIHCYDWNNIRIKKKGVRKSAEVSFESRDEYASFVSRVATKNETNLADINAIQAFSDPESNEFFRLRLNIVTDYITSPRVPYLSIRKIPKFKYDIPELIKEGMFDKSTAELLISKVKANENILFTGAGASGKTTLMNTMLEFIPHTERTLVIQSPENDELFSNTHPEMLFERSVVSRGEGNIMYPLKTLGINGLVQDLNRMIIGEVKDESAHYLLLAILTGMSTWCSSHGSNPMQGVHKLADYITWEEKYNYIQALHHLTSLNTIIHMEKFKVKEICEVAGWDADEQDLIYKTIYKR